MKGSRLNKTVLIELSAQFVCFIFFYLIELGNKNISSELFVNLVFVSMLVTLLIFRSGHIRHMYFAFIFLVITALGSVFGIYELIYITGSLTIGFLILGVINMILFGNKK